VKLKAEITANDIDFQTKLSEARMYTEGNANSSMVGINEMTVEESDSQIDLLASQKDLEKENG
jgi:hypothetical protein